MPKHAAQRRPKPEPVIPDKLYFRIGEVARLCGVETYVLRFWETEFPQMRPNKSGTGQRLYRKRDVELALRVKRLLHDDGYTIAGARQVFAQEARELRSKSPQLPLIEGGASATRVKAKLQKVRTELRDLLGTLSAPPVRKPRIGAHADRKLFD
jgi:DNA-binding transcriptional MerR regulator